MANENTTGDRTVDDVLRDMFVTIAGRTRYPGQKLRDDELMVEEIERLRRQIALLQSRLVICQGSEEPINDV